MTVFVYIMSGPPGSGKTFQANAFAQVMASEGKKGVIVSADHYFSDIPEKGYRGIPFDKVNDADILNALKTYDFSLEGLAIAHPWCMWAYMNVLMFDPAEEDFHIIVDNTNIHNFEINPYYLVAQALKAKVEVLRVPADLDVCIERNTHGVPEDTIRRMHTKFSEMMDHPWIPDVQIPAQHMPWWESRTL